MQYDGANVLKVDARSALAEQLRDLDRYVGGNGCLSRCKRRW